MYSSAGTGMGLIADAVFAELGYLSNAASTRTRLTTRAHITLKAHFRSENVKPPPNGCRESKCMCSI